MFQYWSDICWQMLLTAVQSCQVPHSLGTAFCPSPAEDQLLIWHLTLLFLGITAHFLLKLQRWFCFNDAFCLPVQLLACVVSCPLWFVDMSFLVEDENFPSSSKYQKKKGLKVSCYKGWHLSKCMQFLGIQQHSLSLYYVAKRAAPWCTRNDSWHICITLLNVLYWPLPSNIASNAKYNWQVLE